MRFKGFGGLGKFIGAVLACVLIAQFAMAAEGMGSHRGSFVFMPYWTTDSPFLTVWRITNATDLNDPTLLPIIADPEGKEGPGYNQNPVQLHIFFMETPDCREADQYFPFTPNDYRLIVVNRVRGISGSGWAYGYATLTRDPFPTQVLVWDRFFGDSVVVNTADGWARGWHNWQQWARVDAVNAGLLGGPIGPIPQAQVVVNNFGAAPPAAFCEYSRDTTADYNAANPGLAAVTNDVCVFGPDNVGFNVSWMTNTGAFAGIPIGTILAPPFAMAGFPAMQFGTPSGWYWPMTAPSSFYSSWFTEKFKFSGARANPTEFSITPIEATEPQENLANFWVGFPLPVPFAAPGFNFGETAIFWSDGLPTYTYDAIVYDPDENAFSVPTNTVECQEVLDIYALTDNGVTGLKQGYVHFWAIDPPGDVFPSTNIFNPNVPNWDAAAVLSWDRFPNNKSDLAWGYWTTHDKTSVDDRNIHFVQNPTIAPVIHEDWDPEAPISP
jgi:hypothetical protein